MSISLMMGEVTGKAKTARPRSGFKSLLVVSSHQLSSMSKTKRMNYGTEPGALVNFPTDPCEVKERFILRVTSLPGSLGRDSNRPICPYCYLY